LNRLQATVDAATPERLAKNETFVSAVALAARTAAYTQHEDKRKALRSIVLNSALLVDPDEDLVFMFLRFIDELTPIGSLSLCRNGSATGGRRVGWPAEPERRSLRRRWWRAHPRVTAHAYGRGVEGEQITVIATDIDFGPPRWSPAWLRAAYEGGLSLAELALRTGTSTSAVIAVLTRAAGSDLRPRVTSTTVS
jgi:hypothetical protein